ncbi:hypothetical protein TDB9533_02178 [Thalassocella blandensis]|nr:hypothetical protein TDB9533_02178 [Thalassocella blandensis]
MLATVLEFLPEIAGAVMLNILIAVVISCVIVNRVSRQQSKELKKIRASMNVLSSGSLGMGQRMIALEQKLNSLQSSQEELKQSNMDFSYTQAQKLIEQGIDSQTIAANSGLSSSEIQLMQLLHQSGMSKSTRQASFG